MLLVKLWSQVNWSQLVGDWHCLIIKFDQFATLLCFWQSTIICHKRVWQFLQIVKHSMDPTQASGSITHLLGVYVATVQSVKQVLSLPVDLAWLHGLAAGSSC